MLPEDLADTRYGELARLLCERINSGQLKPGDRMPSVRELCAAHQASPATVTHALHLLEDKGLIEARPRSGFYVRRRQGHLKAPQQCADLEPRPQVVELSEHRALIREFERSSRHDWLARAHIDPELFPSVAFQRLMTNHARRDPGLLARPGRCGGASALREQLARRSQLLGCDWRADEIFITHDETEAVGCFLRLLTKPGDVVAIQSPCNPALLNLLDTFQLQVLEIPAHPCDGLSVDALAFALKREKVTACIFSANYPNPTGSLLSDRDKQRCVQLLAEYGIALIEDDTSGEFYFGQQRPLPFKAFDETGNVFYCADLSAVIGPGIGLGFAVTGRLQPAFEYHMAAQGTFAPLLFQRALASLMDSGQFEPQLRRLRRGITDNVAAHRDAVERHFPAQTRMACAPGGIFLWLEMPRGFDSAQLQRCALAEGVRFAAGRFFSVENSFSNCLRLNAGNRFQPDIDNAIATLGRLAAAML
ncbi:GntR family transcriptional regulator [Silvimonas iriomotensis]|uniref:Putative 8-amino-7-oxononanoate synthase n=1 Tax=Silvimonas iriomotensis TaxID=449662 RepID=A0ABQ2PB72_9NEIS|nr:GntR family transcriptional regulator [Silvimonas iriomotensis]